MSEEQNTDPRAPAQPITLSTFRGRTIALSCERDGKPADDGRAYVTIEVDLADARRCPLRSVVNLTVPTRDEHIRSAVVTEVFPGKPERRDGGTVVPMYSTRQEAAVSGSGWLYWKPVDSGAADS